jgi:hypothetical protein
MRRGGVEMTVRAGEGFWAAALWGRHWRAGQALSMHANAADGVVMTYKRRHQLL